MWVPWCSGYHVCFTRRRSRDRSPREPFAIFCHLYVTAYIDMLVPWCSGFRVCFTRRRSRVQSPREALPSFCDIYMYVKLIASIYTLTKKRSVGSLV